MSLFLFIALILLTCVSEPASRGTPCAGEVLSRDQGSKDLFKAEQNGSADGPDVMSKEKKSMMKHQDFCPKKWKNRTTINCHERELGESRLGRFLGAECMLLRLCPGLEQCASADSQQQHRVPGHAFSVACPAWAEPGDPQSSCTQWSRGLQASPSLPKNHVQV